MPAPPKTGETEDQFMGRCMSTYKKEGKEHKQSVAICLNMWRQKGEDIVVKLDRLLGDDAGATTTGNVAINTAGIGRGSQRPTTGISTIGYQCPKGKKWDKKKRKCVNESSVVGGSYIDGSTVNIVGSGQTRVVGGRDNEIDVIRRLPKPLKFNTLLGIYVPGDENET